MLKKYGLSRSSKLGIGKQMGDYVWIHKSYAHVLKKYVDDLPLDEINISSYDIIRFNLKTYETSFIQCNDFNNEDEPEILLSLTYRHINGEYVFYSKKCFKNRDNKQIYHHKWMFVSDDFAGFDVSKSKERSLLWKRKLGNNKTISSKIGYSKFWKEWLKENNVE